MFAERIELLFHTARADADIENLVGRMIEVCKKYEYYVSQTNMYMLIGQVAAQDTQTFRDTAQNLDSSRRITHQSVIAYAKSVDRICKQRGIPLIYGGDYEDYRATANFATLLAREYMS